MTKIAFHYRVYQYLRTEERKRTAEVAGLSSRLEKVEAKVGKVDDLQTWSQHQELRMGAMRIRQDIADRRVRRLGEEAEDTSRQRSKDCLIMSGQGKLKNLYSNIILVFILSIFIDVPRARRHETEEETAEIFCKKSREAFGVYVRGPPQSEYANAHRLGNSIIVSPMKTLP